MTLEREDGNSMSTLWIGRADVQPQPGNDMFDSAPGAFANVVGLAKDVLEFENITRSFFGSLGCDLIGLERIYDFAIRSETGGLPEEMMALASNVSPDEPILFDTFYIYEEDE